MKKIMRWALVCDIARDLGLALEELKDILAGKGWMKGAGMSAYQPTTKATRANLAKRRPGYSTPDPQGPWVWDWSRVVRIAGRGELSPIDTLNGTPPDKLHTRELQNLKCGHDRFSRMKLAELRELYPSAEAEKAFARDDKLLAICLRWLGRGLRVDMAIAKVYADIEFEKEIAERGKLIAKLSKRKHKWYTENPLDLLQVMPYPQNVLIQGREFLFGEITYNADGEEDDCDDADNSRGIAAFCEAYRAGGIVSITAGDREYTIKVTNYKWRPIDEDEEGNGSLADWLVAYHNADGIDEKMLGAV